MSVSAFFTLQREAGFADAAVIPPARPGTSLQLIPCSGSRQGTGSTAVPEAVVSCVLQGPRSYQGLVVPCPCPVP